MIRHLFKKFSFSSLCLSVFLLLFPPFVHAQGPAAWAGVCIEQTVDGQSVATIQGLQCLIANVLQIAVSIIGFAGFVMMIIGAFRYLTSGGNAKGVDEGQKTITYAILGLVVALSAYFILNAIATFTGIPAILSFTIPR